MERIFLIGYMGAGKTFLGNALACKMHLFRIDTDHFIENRYRKKVSEIFAVEGENRFREIEHKIISELSELEDVIISTGGGLPCFNNNMELMNRKGTTVYLEVSVDELVRRLKTDKATRPVLQGRSGEELRAFIAENLEKRKPFYEQAKIRFNAELMDGKKDIDTLAERLKEIISLYNYRD
ncbi:MAG: shikimate kinase [Tannerella sp.]|jgi:shikimate kinase|nr:shikimate kinase [Tannerella sp.]